MPASKPPAFKEGERLIKISELPEWMQPAFAGMKELNRIQSRVSQTAMYTSENILMCAPTGAGKTNVAMLTILQEVSCHTLPSCLFLATMEALCGMASACNSGSSPWPDLILASPGTVGRSKPSSFRASLKSWCWLLQMGQHLRSDGTVDTSSFKIVYVAPMKALVAEMVGNFSQRLKKFGMQVTVPSPAQIQFWQAALHL